MGRTLAEIHRSRKQRQMIFVDPSSYGPGTGVRLRPRTFEEIEARAIEMAWIDDNTTADSEMVWKRLSDQQRDVYRRRAGGAPNHGGAQVAPPSGQVGRMSRPQPEKKASRKDGGPAQSRHRFLNEAFAELRQVGSGYVGSPRPTVSTFSERGRYAQQVSAGCWQRRKAADRPEKAIAAITTWRSSANVFEHEGAKQVDAAPPPEIVIQHPAEHYSVREVAVEQIARLLCRADGKDPDADWRVGSAINGGGSTMLTIHDPAPQMWRQYRDKATAALEAAFAKAR